MKATFFLFVTSFIFCSTSFGQNISVGIVVNDDPNRFYFSRSEHNILKVIGTGCERVELRGVGVALVERSGDYYVQIKTTGKQASVTMYCVSNGKCMILGTQNFAIIN